MRVLVCGGRDFRDSEKFWSAMEDISGVEFIIDGGAPGADQLARRYRRIMEIPGKTFLADWQKHGRAAGPIRNKQMIDEGKPDLVVAFPGGRGTANMVEQARAAGVRVIEVAAP